MITPPFQVPDEYVHYFRAYSITSGSLTEERHGELIGNWLPISIASMSDKIRGDIQFHFEQKMDLGLIREFAHQPLEPRNKTFVHFPSGAVYTPIPYAPQVVGIGAGRLFSLSPLALVYLGRLANLAVWIILMYMALTIIPIGRWLLLLLALTPMSLFQTASLSPDALTNALAFLLVAIFLRHAAQSEPLLISSKNTWLIIALALVFSLTKQLYFFIPLIFLALGPGRFINKKQYLFFGCVLLAAVILPNLAWWQLVHTIIIPLQEGINPKAQITHILAAPLSYLSILGSSIHANGMFYLRTFIGRLGWLDTPLPSWIYVSSYAMLVFYAITRKKDEAQFRIKLFLRLVLFGAFVAGVILVLTSLYVSWTPVGAKSIEGVQGRYFIPLAPLLFFAIYGILRLRIPNSYYSLIAGMHTVLVLAITTQTLLLRYYG